MTTMNNVQSLDKKRKRGRPKSVLHEQLKALYANKKFSARSSIYNMRSMVGIGGSAFRLGLVDEDFRDAATGRRVQVKMYEIARLFTEDFWDTPNGQAWLTKNWPAIVEMSAEEVKAWVRQNNSRARTQ
jgi:hypothetical protein